jgi:hypothetical protein
MPTKPMPVRFEPELLSLLQEGVRRTPHKKQELIRMTLRQHLASVIEAEASGPKERITNIKPWRESDLKKAYKRVGADWDQLEHLATRAQGQPGFDD